MAGQMIKNPPLLEEFERGLAAKGTANLSHNFRLIDALYEEAVALGAFPMKDKLEGLDSDIKVARVVNCVPKSS
jgi:hypothetical protein